MINQHPLICKWSRAARKQMHGQHSGFILLKYFKQARSAAVSDPLASAAFLHTGQAALISSTQAICKASVHCWATVKQARRANKARIRTDLIVDYLLIIRFIIIGGNKQYQKANFFIKRSFLIDKKYFWVILCLYCFYIFIMNDKIKVVHFGHYFNLHPQDAFHHIQQLNNAFADFTEAFKERIELEIDYSKDLIKISKILQKYINAKQSTPISYIASALKVEHQQRARNALELAEYIHTQIQVPCLNLVLQNRENLKKMEKQLKKLYREGEAVQELYQKHLKKYHKIHQEWEEKVIAKNIMNFTPGVTNSQKEKASIKLQEQKKQKQQHRSKYLASLQNFNSFANRYNNVIGGYIGQLQQMTIQQITLQMDSMRKLIVSQVNMFKNIQYDLLNISKQMQSLSPALQIQKFVAEKKDLFLSPIISIYSQGPIENYQFIDLKSPISRTLMDQTLMKIDKGIFAFLLQNKNNNKLKLVISQLIKKRGSQEQSINQIQVLRDIINVNKSLRNLPINGSNQLPLINQVTPICIQIIQGIVDILAFNQQDPQQPLKSLYQMLSHYMSIHHFYRYLTFLTLEQYQNIHEQTITNKTAAQHYLVILKALLQKSINAKDIFVARATITLIFTVTIKTGSQQRNCYQSQCFKQVEMYENLDFWLSIIFQSTYQLLTLTPVGQKEHLKQIYLMRQKNVIFSGLLTYCHYMIMLGIQVSFVKSIMYWFSNIYHLNKEHQTDLVKTITSSLQIYKQQ